MHDQGCSGRGVCERIASRVARSVGRSRFDRYFKSHDGWRLDGERLFVQAPTPFYASWLESRFGAALREAAQAEAGIEPVRLEWRIEHPEPGAPAHGTPRGVETPEVKRAGDGDCQDGGAVADPVARRATRDEGAAPPAPRPRLPRRGPRGENPETLRCSLADFVVGPCNRLAHQAAVRLADADHRPGFQLLVVHGDCGVGKTHLLQGLARAYAEGRAGARVRYLTGEAFTNEYVAAVRAGRIEAFRASVRRLDLLCIDDVHFVAGKTATQNELLHTFEALDLSGSRVAVASDAHPRDVKEFNRKLVSRCLGGMVVRIDPPDRTTRAAVLSRLAEQRGLRIDPAARDMIADRAEGSVRDLLGVIARVDAMASMLPALTESGVVGAALVRHALGSSLSARPPRPVRVGQVIDAVSGALAVDPSDVLGRGRHRRVVLARSIVAYLARQVTTMSFPEIAQAMNRSNHSTVVTAAQRVSRQIRAGAVCDDLPGGRSEPLADLCERLRRAVTGSSGIAAA